MTLERPQRRGSQSNSLIQDETADVVTEDANATELQPNEVEPYQKSKGILYQNSKHEEDIGLDPLEPLLATPERSRLEDGSQAASNDEHMDDTARIISPRETRSDAGEARSVHTLESATREEELYISSESSRIDLSNKDKLGIFAILYLSVGTVFVLVAFGIIVFFWFGSPDNSLWREVMTRDWLTKGVTICAEVIKQAVSFQIGAAVAMMAAISLEGFQVLYPYAASLTMMRSCASSGTTFTLLWHQFVGVFRKRTNGSIWLLILILLVTGVFGITQALSVLLVSDISPGIVVGVSEPVNMTTGFNYTTPDAPPQLPLVSQGLAWTRVASIYPTFAEYSEPPYIADGVKDTGLTLRAFLPFESAQDRENLQEYIGRTTVVDTRVTCQPPNLFGEMIGTNGSSGSLVMRGSLTASRDTPRLVSWNWQANSSVPNPFSCEVPTISATDPTQWRLSICFLTEYADTRSDPSVFSGPVEPLTGGPPDPFIGGLIAEFVDTSSLSDYHSGSVYLFLNVTTGASEDWLLALGYTDSNPSWFSPAEYSERGEWLDLVFSNGNLVLSTTLCFTAFDQADLSVRIRSPSNRTESTPSFNQSSLKYSFEFLRQQFGQYETWSAEDRGILQIDNQSWIATLEELDVPNGSYPQTGLYDGSYLYTYAFGTQANVSGALCSGGLISPSLSPDIMHIWLIQEILQTGGSIAFALQSLITLLNSMTYYDNLGNFDRSDSVQQTFFVLANIPQSFTGFAVVAAVLCVHFILMAVVVYFFLIHTQFSRLGATWAALSQVVNGEVHAYLESEVVLDDDDVKKNMEKNGSAKDLVGAKMLGGKVGLFIRKEKAQ